jgi:hypothetical protein
MKKQLIEEFIKRAKNMSQEMLNEDGVKPICLVFQKDSDTIEVININFNSDNKEAIRLAFKRYLLNKKIDKYVTIFDAKMTSLDKVQKNVQVVKDVIIISVYSAKDKIVRAYPYGKDKILIDDEDTIIKMDGRDNFQDCWDIWGEETDIDSDTNKKYQKYKNENKELYKGCLSEDDEKMVDIKTNGKTEVFDMGMGFSLKIYRNKGKIAFEAYNDKGKVFLSSKVMDENEDFEGSFEDKLKVVKDTINKFREGKI